MNDYHDLQSSITGGVHLERAPASAVSHIVFVQPGEAFLGVEASEGRFPVTGARFVGEAMVWERADGASEFLDLMGSPALAQLQVVFDTDDWLMVVTYQSLAGANPESAPVDVAFVSPRELNNFPARAPRG